jgi:hypothetical protein
MNIDISSQTKARLAAKAQELGLSVEAFIEKLMSDAGGLKTSTTGRKSPEWPVLDLGVRGSLRRRDIYDDAC